MRRIAKFHKVSPAQFAKDWKDTFPTADEKEILSVYENIPSSIKGNRRKCRI